jgi:hypothetical protein
MGKDPITASALWLRTQAAQMRYDSSTDLILTNGILSGTTFATFDIPGDSLGQLNNIIPSIDLSGNNDVLNGFPLYVPGDATSQGSIVNYMFGTRESAFVYLAAAGSLYYSYDGISWSPSSPSGVQSVNALASNNTMVLALGDGISYSTNGISWTPSLSAEQIFASGSGPASVKAAAWYGGWIAVGSSGSSTVCVKSADGISWTEEGNLPTLITQTLTCIHFAGVWVAAGSGTNSVAFSDDGVAWYPSTSGNMLVNAGSATSLLYTKNRWFMGITGGNQTTTLATSQDGKLWISASASVPFTVAALATNGQVIVAVGTSIMYSTDGVKWKAAKTDSSGNFTSVTWNGAFMAGSPTGILTSPDGIQWTSAPAFSGPVTGLTRFTNTFGTLPCVKVQSTAPITLANKTLYIKFGKTAMDSALTTYLQYLAALAVKGMIPNTTPGQQNESYVNKSLLPSITAGTTFTIGTTSITPTLRGVYNPTTSYHLGDLVYYPDASGSLNMCLIGPDLRGPSYSVVVGIEPVEDPYTSPYWHVVINRGWNTFAYVSAVDLALNTKAISTNYIFCDSNMNGTIFPANLTLQLSATALQGYTLFGSNVNQLTRISSFGYAMGSNGPLYALLLDKPPVSASNPLYVRNGLANFITLNTYASNNYLSMNVASLGTIIGNAVTQTTMSAISTASSSLAVVNSAISSMGTYGQLASLSYGISQNMVTCLDQYSLGLQIYQSDITLGNAARIPLTRANLLSVTSTITSIVSNVASASSYIASGDSSNTGLILSTITADAASLATTNSYYNNIIIPSDIGYSVFTNQYVEVIPTALSNLDLPGDFTIEWVTVDSAPLIAEFGALNFWTSNANLMNPFGSSAVPLSALSSAAANPPYLNCSIGPNQNHFAWVRHHTTLSLYINGSSVYSTSTGVSGPVAGSNFVLGSNSMASLWQGGLRNFRVDTTAIYTSNFTTSPIITGFTDSVFTSNLSPLSTSVFCLPMNKSFIFNDFSPLHNSVSTMGESMSSVTLSYSTMITPFTQVPYGAGYLTLPALPTSASMLPWSYPQTAVTATWSASTGATSYTVKFYYSLTNTTSGGTLLETVTTTTTTATTTTAIANGLFIYATVCANNQIGSSFSITTGTEYVDQPPTNVEMIPLTTGQTAMTVTWTAAPIVTTYTVSFYTNSTASTTGGTLLQTLTGVTGTTKSTTLPLVYATYYYATVVALTNVGTSTTSVSSSAIQFTPPPSTPAGVTMAAVPANTNTLSLSWSASSFSQSYTVSFYTNPTNSTSGGTLVQTLSLLNTTSTTSQTLTAPGFYYATVTGVNTTASSSPATSSATYYTPACGPVTNAAMSPYTGSGAVTVIWTAAQYAASYTVVFYSNSSNSTSGGSAVQTLATTSTTQTSSVTLTQGNYYYATVTATNPNLNSATVTTSTVLVVPIPASPTGVTMTTWVTGVSVVTVSWSAVTNATSYTVKYYSRATNATSGGTLVQTVTATGTTSSSTAALSPAYYYATVVANNSTGSSAETTSSNTAFYNPFLPAPSTISVTVTSNVTASWTAVTNMYGTPTYTVSYYTGTSPSTTTLLTSVSGITALSNTPDVQLMYRNYYSASVVANLPGISSLTTTTASSAIFMPTTVSPTYFPNITYWFDAADASALTTSGGAVTAWSNKGSIGGSATLTGTFPTTTLNSLNTVQFNYQQFMNIPSYTGTGATGTSIFMVMKATSNLAANTGYYPIVNAGGPNLQITTSGTTVRYSQNNDAALYVNSNTTNLSSFTGGFTIFSSVGNGTTALPAGVWNNGSNIAFSSGTGSSSTAFSAPTLGSSSAAGMPFQLAEIIIYTSNLPYTSRQAVEGYLAWKWGLQTSLPYNHPFAVYPTFSPLTLPGLQLWLDGTDPSATGRDFADGSALTSWNDKSGYGRNIAFYNIVGAQTTSSAASINNLSAVHLNSPNAHGIRAFGAVPAGTFSNAYTTFAVYKFNSLLITPQVGYELSILSRTTSLTNQNLYMQAGESRYVGSTLVSDSTTSSNNWIVTSNLNTNILTTSITYPGGSNINFAEFLNGSQLSLLVANSPVTFPASTTLNDSNASSFISLANSNGNGLYSRIDIRYCEVLMFNQPFTTAQRQQVEGYLAAKWGVTSELPLTHPYATSPSITPSLFPGNQLWLDATDPQGTGLTPASLTTWTDKSGFAQNLVLTGAISPSNTSNGQGLVIPTSVSGKSYIPPNTFIKALSYFAVYKSLSQTGSEAFINRGTQATPSLGPYSVYTTNSLTIADANSTYPYTVANIYQPNISIVYTSINQLSNTISQSLNGSFSNIAGVTAWVPNDPKSFVQFFDRDLGSGSGGLNFNGIVYEVLVFDRPFSTEQRQMMEGYLASKWSLQSTLPLLHPYRGMTPILSPTYEFTPLSIPSLQLWLDGNDPLATGIAPLINYTVNTWYDKSDFANHAIGSNSPKFTASGISFNGSNQSFVTPYTAASSAETGFIIVNMTSPVNNCPFITGTSSNTSRGFWGQISGVYGFTLPNAAGTINSYTTMGPANAYSTTYLLSYTYNHTGVTLNQNGTSVASNTSNIVPALGIGSGTSNPTIIGASVLNNSLNGKVSWMSGTISEVIIYNSVLPQLKRQQVEGYLAWKWGLTTLPTTHAYSLKPPENTVASIGSAPISPQNLALQTAWGTGLAISWTYNSNAEFYQFIMGGSAVTPGVQTLSNASFSGLASNTSYTIQVVAKNSYGSASASITASTSSNFNPATISGVQAWYDANDIMGNGTALANGTAISTWYDKSGNARNATASNGTITLVNNSLASLPGLYLTGSNYFGASIPAGTFSSNYVWFAVYKNTNTTGKNISVVNRVISGGSYANPFLYWNTTAYITGSNGTAAGGNSWNSPYSLYNTSASILNAYLFQPSAISFGAYTNGTSLLFTPAAGNTGPSARGDTGNLLLLGTEASLGSLSAFNGFFHEVLVYNSYLTTIQRQAVEGYLAWKWGLQHQLPPFHRYASVAPSSVPILSFPHTLPGLQLWLDAMDPLGTGTAPANGTTLTYLADKSGNSYMTTFETFNSLVGVYYYNQALTTPGSGTYTSGTYPYITPSTSVATGIMARIPPITFIGATTVFVVYNSYANVQSPLFTRTITPASGQAGNLGNHVDNQGTSYYIGSNNGTTFSTGYSFYSPSRSMHNVNINQNAGTLSILSNASSKYSGTAAVTPSDNGSLFSIFSRGDLGTNSFSANLNEILVFNTVLTTAQTQLVEGYLAWKWGLQSQLPGAHPYKSASP